MLNSTILYFIKMISMKNHRIALLGGGGRTGKLVLYHLINQGYQVKCLLRNPQKYQIESPLIEVVEGDALNPVAVKTLIQGCQSVISTVGQRKDEPLVASQATLNILEAMAELKIKRYVLLAGLNVDTPFDNKGPETVAATEWMKMTYPAIHADRQKTYSILSNSDVDWTLVRVPFIEFTETEGETVISLDDCLGSKISAGCIASFVVKLLTDNNYIKMSPFIANL
ncbi:NAD(P)-dependent oxidoreductase [Algoriphagus aestuariicola]|nr:NAD(P)H-binding protein [Algoriphagus aestuariicola]